MKITIDKVQKTVTVHESENIAEVIDFLTGAGIDLNEFKLNTNGETFYIPYPNVQPNYPINPLYPYGWPTIIY